MSPKVPTEAYFAGDDEGWSMTIPGPSTKVVLNGESIDPKRLRSPITISSRKGKTFVEVTHINPQLVIVDANGATHTLIGGELKTTPPTEGATA